MRGRVSTVRSSLSSNPEAPKVRSVSLAGVAVRSNGTSERERQPIRRFRWSRSVRCALVVGPSPSKAPGQPVRTNIRTKLGQTHSVRISGRPDNNLSGRCPDRVRQLLSISRSIVQSPLSGRVRTGRTQRSERFCKKLSKTCKILSIFCTMSSFSA